jgi:hypothetical protein
MKCKTTLFALSSFAFFSLVVISCKKSNSNSSSSSNGQFTATIGSTAWVSNVPTSGLYVTSASTFELGGEYLKSGDSTAFAVSFATPFILHAPISSDTAEVDLGYINATTQAEYDGGGVAGHSLLTISSWDSVNHKISGTFSGVLYNITGGSDSLIVTNGAFTSAYTVQ